MLNFYIKKLNKILKMKKLNVKRMLNLRSFALVGIFLMAIFAVSCNTDDDIAEPMYQDAELKSGKSQLAVRGTGDQSITSLALASPQFEVLVSALVYVTDNYVGPEGETINLVEFFDGSDQFTVFAPNNEAFVRLLGDLGATKLEDLDPGLVLQVLLYHVTDGRRAANSVLPKKGERVIETLLDGASFSVQPNGTIIDVDNRGAQIQLGGSNISASNGIIHEISEVILPIALP